MGKSLAGFQIRQSEDCHPQGRSRETSAHQDFNFFICGPLQRTGNTRQASYVHVCAWTVSCTLISGPQNSFHQLLHYPYTGKVYFKRVIC